MPKRCNKHIVQQPLLGVLDGATPFGNADSREFRVVLNTAMIEEGKLARRPGWQGLMKDQPGFVNQQDVSRGNRDLFDQLLHLAEQVPYPPKREVVNLHFQAKSDCNAHTMIACTRSRIYADTGSSANWRILADGLGPQDQYKLDVDDPTDPGQRYQPFGSTRWMAAQLGNYVLFTNDYNPVLGWGIGDPADITLPVPDPPVTVPPTPKPTPIEYCRPAQAARPVLQLMEIGVLRAGCICSWSGFIFLGDVETDVNGRECDTIFWSDFNSPLDWVPEGESVSGYVNLGKGEKVMRMEPMAGQLRVYTNQAIYNVTLVAGEELFRFTEIYRGPNFLAFRYGFANLGDSHIFLTNSGLVELKLYDSSPQRVEWLHKASGVIMRGLNDKLLLDYPGTYTGFGPLDVNRCNQITAGFDRCRREVWFSWPTASGDVNDCEGVRRATMVLSRLYRHASLVDCGFSSFCNFVPRNMVQVRDWIVQIGACTPEYMDEHYPRNCKEGTPYNLPIPPPVIPTSIVGKGEDGLEDPMKVPADPMSICALYGKEDILTKCAPCEEPCRFSMACTDTADFTLKEQRDEIRFRERYVGP